MKLSVLNGMHCAQISDTRLLIRRVRGTVILMAAVFFIGCSGGSSSSGGSSEERGAVIDGDSGSTENAANLQNRISKISYDFDLNGISDAEESFSYDSNGRITERNYLYIDDGVEDVYRMASLEWGGDTSEGSHMYRYNDSGLVIFSEVNFIYKKAKLLEGSSKRITFDYVYANNVLSSITQNLYYGDGSLRSTILFEYYRNESGKLDRFTAETIFVDDRIIIGGIEYHIRDFDPSFGGVGLVDTSSIIYDESGRPKETRWFDADGNLRLIDQYVWTDVGLVSAVLLGSGDANNMGSMQYRYQYDEKNCLASFAVGQLDSEGAVMVSSLQSEIYRRNETGLITAVEAYRGEGPNIQAVATIETENLPFIPLVIPEEIPDLGEKYRAYVCGE